MPTAPFGPPDAATASLDLDQQFANYVNIDGRLSRADDVAIPRIIFGRKGSGKSHYLRALNAVKRRDASVIAYGPSTDPPPHDWVIRLSLALGISAIPMWGTLWQRAILASAAATLLAENRKGALPIHDVIMSDFEPTVRELLGPRRLGSGYLSPFAAARRLLARCGTIERFHSMLGSQQWQVLEEHLEPIIAVSPPLYFFLDNLDAVESYAPRPWRSCQRGLLNAILALAEDSRWNRIHVIVALKDTVVQPLYDSAHGQKYTHNPTFHRLDWSTSESMQFLTHKIETLADEWIIKPECATPVERWLGLRTIDNRPRGCVEHLEAYLLRHTLLLPRDIVELGNCLCDAIARRRQQHEFGLSGPDVTFAVNRAARQIGKTGVYGAAIEMARLLMPSDAPLHGAGEAYGSTDAGNPADDDMTVAISDQYARVLTDVSRTVRSDRFDLSALDAMRSAVNLRLRRSLTSDSDDAVGALWRLGMVGVIEGDLETGDVTFYGHSEHDGSTIGASAERFAFHPSMIDYLERIQPVGAPVYPEPGFLKVLNLA